MARRRVIHPFVVQMDNGAAIPFVVGGEFIPDELIDHALVRANTVAVDDAPSDAPADNHEDEPAAITKEDLIAECEARGIEIDRRWGMARIQAALAGQ